MIDLHFDVVVEDIRAPEWLASPPNPASFRANLPGFERLLAHNRGARIVWAHAGSDMLGGWTVDLSRRLLAAHPNLFMSIRMAPGHAPANHPLTPKSEGNINRPPRPRSPRLRPSPGHHAPQPRTPQPRWSRRQRDGLLLGRHRLGTGHVLIRLQEVKVLDAVGSGEPIELS